MTKLSDVTVATRRNPAATSAVTLQLINNRCGDEKLRTNLIKQLGGDVIQGLVGEPAVGALGAVALLVEVLTGKRLWSGMKEITSGLMGGACCLLHSDWKDMVHVGAVFAFDAAALDVEFTQLLDEVVAALNVLQLAVVPLQRPADTLRTF